VRASNQPGYLRGKEDSARSQSGLDKGRESPTITYATSTVVRLRRQFFVTHNRKYFVLCRYRMGKVQASPRASGKLP